MSNVKNATPEDMKTMALPGNMNPMSVPNHVTDIQYGSLPQQLLDIYRPEHYEGKLPVLFYVHGGGWSMGSRYENAAQEFMVALKRNYAVIVMEYRLAPQTKFPEFLYDVKTAVRWARANADKYDLDTERFCMVGDSAGAHISLMVGLTSQIPELEGSEYGWANESSDVKAVCAMYAPCVLYADEEAWYEQSGVARLVFRDDQGKDMLLSAFGTHDPEQLKKASPISYIHKDMPYTLLQHGQKDCVVPYQHSAEFAEEAKRLDASERVTLEIYPERNHSDVKFVDAENAEHILDFFDRVLSQK